MPWYGLNDPRVWSWAIDGCGPMPMGVAAEVAALYALPATPGWYRLPRRLVVDATVLPPRTAVAVAGVVGLPPTRVTVGAET